MQVIDLSALKNYQRGTFLKDKRGSTWHVDFVGNFEVSLTNVKTGLEKEVTINKIVKNFTIIDSKDA